MQIGDFGFGNAGEIILNNGSGTKTILLQAAAGISLASNKLIGFNPNTSFVGNSNDVGIGRNAAGVLEINNYSLVTYRDLKLRNQFFTGYSNFTEIAAPSTPASDTLAVYAVDDSGTTKLAIKDSAGTQTILGSGGVISIGVSTNAAWLTVGNSPIISSGTITVNATTGLTANQVLASPNGSTGAVSLRSLVADDIPSLPQSKITNTPFDAGNSSTALTINFNNGATQYATLTGNATFTFSNPVDGGKYFLRLTQDGTGSRTVTWPATVFWASGTAPVLTTTLNAVDVVSCVYMSGTGKYYCSA